MSDSLTLYKLMILYLLKHVRFPLTHSQLSDFFLGKEYCSYFTFQQVCQELLDAHLLKDDAVRNYVRYQLTREGEEALSYFGDQLSAEIRQDMDQFLEENKIRLRKETGVTADYSENPDGEYTVRCEIMEGRGALMRLELTVPAEEQAQIMCSRFHEANQELYAAVMRELLRD